MLKKIALVTIFLATSCVVLGMRKNLNDKHPEFEHRVNAMKMNQEAEKSAKERRKQDPKDPKKLKIRRNSMEKFNKKDNFKPKYNKNFKKREDDSSSEDNN